MLLFRYGAYDEAEKYGRERLNAIHFSKEADVEIINYEIVCKHTKGKANVSRLEDVLAFAQEFRTKAAINALLNKKKEMIECIRKAIELDRRFRHLLPLWPVFEDFHNDPEFLSLQTASGTPIPVLVAVPDTGVRTAA